MFKYSGIYTDHYQLTMSQAYLLKGRENQTAVFDYFFRRLPFGSGYAVFAGLGDLLDVLENFTFSRTDIYFLEKNGFHPAFLEYLRTFRFSGNIYSVTEGEIIFPLIPVLQVEAKIIEAQLIETVLLNILNYQTLIATKSSRMRLAAGIQKLIDFGLRRAQGPGSLYGSRAAYIGGTDATSNVLAGQLYGIPVSGSLGHSFIESYDNELEAFMNFCETQPGNCILLLDTYETLKSGLPNAIRTAKLMEKKGIRLSGIRIDSGDLAFLAGECRRRLDSAGLDYVKIAVSNELDEYVIRSLLEQGAPIDVFGVGTKLITGHSDGALDGVFKLASFDGKPRIKMTENPGKMTLPHRKQILRILDNNGNFSGADAIITSGETDVDIIHHPLYALKSLNVEKASKEPLLHTILKNGKRIRQKEPVGMIAQNCRERLQMLPSEYKRLDNPHIYKVGLSSRLMNERNRLIDENQKRYESIGNS